MDLFDFPQKIILLKRNNKLNNARPDFKYKKINK